MTDDLSILKKNKNKFSNDVYRVIEEIISEDNNTEDRVFYFSVPALNIHMDPSNIRDYLEGPLLQVIADRGLTGEFYISKIDTHINNLKQMVDVRVTLSKHETTELLKTTS